MRHSRVAVEVGSSAVRVAVAEPDGVPRLIAELPVGQDAGGAGGTTVAPLGALPRVLAEVVGPAVGEVVVVHPAGRPPPAGFGFRAVPAPVAAAAGTGARAVLDVGCSGAGAALLQGGRLVAHGRAAVGGARLDDAVAALLGVAPPEARRVREALSLQPTARARLPDGREITVDSGELRAALVGPLGEAVRLLGAVLAGARPGSGPVLLVGGLARTPLLAELVDAAGIAAAVVMPRPDAAAVLGALTLPFPPVGPGSPQPPPRSDLPQHHLPPPPPRRHGRPVLATVAAAGAAATLLGAGSLLPSPSTPSSASTPAAVPSGVLVQYGYRLDLPAGWEHGGGLPERRRSLLTPVAAPEGSDLIAVERTPLGYDTGAEPQRARAELRAEFEAAVASGAPLSGYDPDARAAGRDVTTYLQRDPGSVVEWFVVLDGDAQLSVGCRYTPAGATAVREACEVVVGSLRRAL